MDDVVIVGGGIIGAATAYFLSKEGRKVRVIERDPTYKKASFPLSLGGFRRQFFQKENINLGKFALEFISNISNTLKTKNNPNPTASMVPNGYLLLFGPEHAEEQYEALKNHKACDAGTKNIPASKLKEVFSWINPNGLETATYTDSKIEGWIDPHMFHNAIKNKAIELGAIFEKGNVKKISDIKAKTIVSAAGCWTKELLDDIPVVPQKHTVFRVKCPKHYSDMPLTGVSLLYLFCTINVCSNFKSRPSLFQICVKRALKLLLGLVRILIDISRVTNCRSAIFLIWKFFVAKSALIPFGPPSNDSQRD